jgi:DNA repair exonuclease SbcCD ATPase subunit
LDEASNHLDLECSEALSEAVGKWGGDQGALVVVSHDRNFCERIPFTHVATVQDAKLILEERGVRESDWSSTDLSKQKTKNQQTSIENSRQDTEQTPVDPSLRKKLYNAPKRIEKLESLIEKAELKIAKIDEEMLSVGSDVGKLVDLNKEKETLSDAITEYMSEWEELEELLTQVA